jgi:aryl-alcohol dehydrogenase-like predicted oxidoreductase
MRLAIGAAQMGMAYGISNRGGRVAADEVGRMLDLARQEGIDTVDTAVAYGSSEEALGAAGLDGMKVVTKIGPVPEHCRNATAWVIETLLGSCRRLRRPSVHGVLLHRVQDLAGDHAAGLARGLRSAVDRGLATVAGVSVYSPEDLDLVVGKIDLGLVQLPRNPIDRRFERTGWLGRLKDAGVEVHVRSIFLQGLLIMSHQDLAGRFGRWERPLARWHDWVARCGISPVEACIAHAMDEPHIDRVVVGFDGAEQLREACDAARRRSMPVPTDIAIDDLDLLLPSRWPAE